MPTYGQGTKVAVQQFINHKDWNFVENKGQLPPNPLKGEQDVKYYSHSGGAHIYCRSGMISFVFTKTEPDENISEATGKNVETQCLRLTRAQAIPRNENGSGSPLPRDAFNASLQKKITTNRIDLLL